MTVINYDEFNERIEILTTELMIEVIDIFSETYPDRKQNISSALEKNDAKALEFEVHALKNDISQFSANKLFDKTQFLLEKIRDKQSADFRTDVYEILDKIDNELLPELESWYKQHA